MKACSAARILREKLVLNTSTATSRLLNAVTGHRTPQQCLQAVLLLAWLATVLASDAAVISEDFGTDPALRGWRSFGDTSLFHWNALDQNLAVTWDSSRSNSFFYVPLGTVLGKADDFEFSFDLRLSDIRLGNTPGKTNEFEISVGLINYRSAINAKAFRGAGVSATYGVRNIVEFDYFPDAGFGDTFSTTVISTNNVFAYYNNFPLELTLQDTFRVTMSYAASNQVLRTSAKKNGLSFSSLGDVSLAGKPDFRVDSFAIISYSDAIQTGSPAFYGSVLAHGVIDNVQLVVPPPPLSNLQIRVTNSVCRAEFTSLTNWLYTLEASANFGGWSAVSASTPGTGDMMHLSDNIAGARQMFYRVRADKP